VLKNASLVGFVASTDLDGAEKFYGEVLGLSLVHRDDFACVFDAGGTTLRVTKVDQAVVAPYTVLGWEVTDVVTTARELAAKGVVGERFPEMQRDEDGVWTAPGAARILWFKDPEGHVLSVTQLS
jgi:catechol-2,3-dioxygenase